MRLFVWFLLILAGFVASNGTVLAASADNQPCLKAIDAAEKRQKTPARLMRAIGVVESGRLDAKGGVQPWPWTINAGGEGHFFDSKAEAIAAVRALQARGVKSIDVGCMQVNLMHHPDAFASLDEAFDPDINAGYAGRFLSALFRAMGSWPLATAAYHSQTEQIGTDYARKVMAVWGQPMLLPPASPQRLDTGFLAPEQQYRAFAPQQMIFGAFADPASLPPSWRGYGGLPAEPEPGRGARRTRAAQR
jgi:hypothetical protein